MNIFSLVCGLPIFFLMLFFKEYILKVFDEVKCIFFIVNAFCILRKFGLCIEDFQILRIFFCFLLDFLLVCLFVFSLDFLPLDHDPFWDNLGIWCDFRVTFYFLHFRYGVVPAFVKDYPFLIEYISTFAESQFTINVQLFLNSVLFYSSRSQIFTNDTLS